MWSLFCFRPAGEYDRKTLEAMLDEAPPALPPRGIPPPGSVSRATGAAMLADEDGDRTLVVRKVSFTSRHDDPFFLAMSLDFLT